MDFLVHGLSGMAIACLLPQRKWWFPIWGLLTAILPDINLFFPKTSFVALEGSYNLSHSLAGSWILALLCALLLLACDHCQLSPRRFGELPKKHWSLIGAWFFAWLIVLHHLALDCMTLSGSGVQLFLPFNEYRIHFDAIFYFDFLLFIPLLWALFKKKYRCFALCAVLLWTLIYPVGAMSLRFFLEKHLTESQEIALEKILSPSDSAVSEHKTKDIYVLPAAFSPLRWTVLVRQEENFLMTEYFAGMGFSEEKEWFLRPPAALWQSLCEQDRHFQLYERAATFPIMNKALTLDDGRSEYVFSDLRCANPQKSKTDFPLHKIQAFLMNPLPYIHAQIDPSGHLLQAHLTEFLE